MTDRKKTGVTYWATVLLVAVLVLYPLSFGPGCCLVDQRILEGTSTQEFYRPLLVTLAHFPKLIQDAMMSYSQLMPSDKSDAPCGVWWIVEERRRFSGGLNHE